MKAPVIFVIVGLNRREGDLLAWFFDEREARARRDDLNRDEGDEYAYKMETCAPADGESQEKQRW
jgi:hypothetical protein